MMMVMRVRMVMVTMMTVMRVMVGDHGNGDADGRWC